MFADMEKTAARWLKEMQKGYIRIAVLILLSKKQYYGYEIMKEIKERTMGFWRPTAGGVYPILRNLENLGYIEGEWDSQKKRKRKTYRITDAGKVVLERALVKESQITNSMSGLIKEFMKDVFDVEMEPISTLRRPPLFSVFLEDRREKPEDAMVILENRRTQIENMIGELQKHLQTINKQLAKKDSKSNLTDN